MTVRLYAFTYRKAMLGSLDCLETLERGGARIFFGHDPATAKSTLTPLRQFASILPTMTCGNTNAPVIMIAERCADLVGA